MRQEKKAINGINPVVWSLDTLIIGSGCAGFNAADWLYTYNRKDVAILTEGINKGTSRNTGSDKQTYYKLSLASDGADCVYEMAKTLFDGGAVNGDIALTEAACSVKSFIKLSLLGVPFPVNEYGEFIGYKTDHDPRQRATSAGPLTSKYMTEALERSVKSKNIKIFDNMQVAKLLVIDNKIYGLLAFDLAKMNEENYGLTIFIANNIIMATGGPAAVYQTSVYPESQSGGTGLAINEGALCCNLNEWQYGIASIKFRWNLSGTYQQVLPRYISVDKNGNEKEFLREYFDDDFKLLDMVFLKGYQWPFDTAKINGSSIIDIIIHNEIVNKGNRVFMDFTHEPSGLENGFDKLSSETYSYLKNSNALLSLPIKRLEKMNIKAIELYKSHNIDLYNEPLEIAICAQHCNGGIDVNANWQSSVEGLYAVGEASGTFGIYRPGGSALNSAQVGSMRSAEHIATTTEEDEPNLDFALNICSNSIDNFINEIKSILNNKNVSGDFKDDLIKAQKIMTKNAAHLRNEYQIENALTEITNIENNIKNSVMNSIYDIADYFNILSTLATQKAVLNAMLKAAQTSKSRGSGLVLDNDGFEISEHLSKFKYSPEKTEFKNAQFITEFKDKYFNTVVRKVRPIPTADNWFENVWNDFNKRNEKIFSR